MKTPLLIFITILTANFSWAQLIENFDAPAGTHATAVGWTQIGGASNSTNPITIVNPGLSYPGYDQSDIGGAIITTHAGQDIARSFTATPYTAAALQTVYVSFMLNTRVALTGDYFFALNSVITNTAYCARLFIRSNGTGYNIGISRNTEAVTYGTTHLSLNTTYFVVVRYAFRGGSANDSASVYLYSGAIPETETPSSAEAIAAPTSGFVPTQLSSVAFFQNNATQSPALTLDGIKVSDTWGPWGSVLPVSVNAFSASKTESGIDLKWKTGVESAAHYFNIESSTNAQTWQSIGKVNVKGSNSSYAFTDYTPANGANFYRLSAVDLDGKIKYEPILRQMFGARSSFSIAPNPVAGNATVNITLPEAASSGAIVKLVSMSGKTMVTAAIPKGATSYNLNTSNIISGHYVVCVHNGVTVETGHILIN